MAFNIILIIAGVALVLWSAGRLTDGAVAVAEKAGVSQIVIGLTIVAIGTSTPEFFVSLVSAINRTPGIAVGNIVGSNIFNTLLIVGAAAAITPIQITRRTVSRDIPFTIVAEAALLIMCIDARISRLDAIILLAIFAFFMYTTLKNAKQGAETETSEKTATATWKAIAMMVIGLAGLVIGSNIFVNAATSVAKSVGISEAVIGLTIVAGGTSLPELATSIVAARKGDSGIAIGNVVGSNVFNILMILGVTGTICPMTTGGVTFTDLTVMCVSIMLLWMFSYTKMKISRWEGATLLAVYAAYMTYLICNI